MALLDSIAYLLSNLTDFITGKAKLKAKKSPNKRTFNLCVNFALQFYSSKKDFKISEREGWRNLRNALASI